VGGSKAYPYGSTAAVRGHVLAALGVLKVATADQVHRAFDFDSLAKLPQTLRTALGFGVVDPDDSWSLSTLWLPDPQLLHSTNRRWIADHLARLPSIIEICEQQDAARRSVQPQGDGMVQIRARPVVPRRVLRAPAEDGRLTVVAMFGEDDIDPLVLGLNVHDARRLAAMLLEALDRPLRSI
jgi:hypothetical protein